MVSRGLLLRQRVAAQRNRSVQRHRERNAIQRGVVAPVGGLNTVSALGSMPALDAWELVNWIPDVGSVRVRPGYTPQAVNMDEVLSVMSYESSVANKLLAATSDTIWDVSNDSPYMANAAAYTNLRSVANLTSDLWFTLTDDDEMFVLTDDTGTYALSTEIDQGAISVFILPRVAGRIFGHDRFYLEWTGSVFRLVGKNFDGDTILSVESSPLAAGKWYSIMAAWDTATATVQLYIDKSSDANNITVIDNNIHYTYDDWYIGDLAGDFDIAELWFDDTVVDFTSSSLRDDFADSFMRPVALGSDGSNPTGSIPLVYLNNAYTSFGTNHGRGADFIGIPLPALSSPSNIPASLKTGFNSGRWQHWQFNERLFMASGVDTMQVYDGSTVEDSTFTGPTLTNVIGGNSFKNRVYVWEAESASFWYGGVNSISGAMTEFNLSRVGRLGGYIVTMVTWTLDGGNGPDDYAVFLMSTGEVIVYQGSNPGDSSAWALIGVFRIGVPMSRRSAIKFAGDVAIQTQEDYVLLSEVLRENMKRTKISGAARTVAELYASNQGWQVMYYPKGGWMIFNIPVSGSVFNQHILNVITNAWTTFEGMNARCWEVHDRNLFFGGPDGVYRADNGTSDNGALINADARQAWNGMRVQELKRFSAFRPVMQSTGTLTYTASLAYDYGSASVTVEASQASSGTPWGSAWGSPWSPTSAIKQDWRVAAGIGNEVSIRMRVSTRGQTVKWFRTDFLFERGGVM